jgi:hypothetical protein
MSYTGIMAGLIAPEIEAFSGMPKDEAMRLAAFIVRRLATERYIISKVEPSGPWAAPEEYPVLEGD